jgi:large subunit ribosomal protein L9
MKILLIKTVDTLGSAGDVVSVAPGYARNYLIPKKLGVIATPGSLKMAASLKAAAEKKTAEENKAAEAVAAKLKNIVLSFSATADENGQLYGGIGEREIAAALAEKEFDIDRNQVVLPAHIKNVGEHKVEIKIHGDIHESVTVKVEAQA